MDWWRKKTSLAAAYYIFYLLDTTVKEVFPDLGGNQWPWRLLRFLTWSYQFGMPSGTPIFMVIPLSRDGLLLYKVPILLGV